MGSARTYVVQDDEKARVVAYHALAAASIQREEATGRAAKRMPAHPIPAVLLVHAIDNRVQAFCARFGFDPSPTDPLNLPMPMKDIRAALDLEIAVDSPRP